MIVYVNN